MGWSLFIYGKSNTERQLLIEIGRNTTAFRVFEDAEILTGAWNKTKPITLETINSLITTQEKNMMDYRLRHGFPRTNKNGEQADWFDNYNEEIEAIGYLRAVYNTGQAFVEHFDADGNIKKEYSLEIYVG